MHRNSQNKRIKPKPKLHSQELYKDVLVSFLMTNGIDRVIYKVCVLAHTVDSELPTRHSVKFVAFLTDLDIFIRV